MDTGKIGSKNEEQNNNGTKLEGYSSPNDSDAKPPVKEASLRESSESVDELDPLGVRK